MAPKQSRDRSNGPINKPIAKTIYRWNYNSSFYNSCHPAVTSSVSVVETETVVAPTPSFNFHYPALTSSVPAAEAETMVAPTPIFNFYYEIAKLTSSLPVAETETVVAPTPTFKFDHPALTSSVPVAEAETVVAPTPNLFPVDDRTIYKKDTSNLNRTKFDWITSMPSGELMGECCKCTNPPRSIIDFIPPKCLLNVHKRPHFLNALTVYAAAFAARDFEGARAARANFVLLRLGHCPPCAKRDYKISPAVKKIKDEWTTMRIAKCADQDGCGKPTCQMRGAACDPRILEANHLDPKKKVRAVSDYAHWPAHGGVEAMRLEAAKCEFICSFCHKLEPTSNVGRCIGDPIDPVLMDAGKYNGTELEKRQYSAKRRAVIVVPKQEYVKSIKLRTGSCNHCARAVTPENYIAFEFDYIDLATKMKGDLTLARRKGGVCGLVDSHVTRAALSVVYDTDGKITYDEQGVIRVRSSQFKTVLDGEIAKCQLLCRNCRKIRTLDRAESPDESVVAESPDGESVGGDA